MTLMKKVVEIYFYESQSVIVDKEKRHDYKTGGFKLEVTSTTTTLSKIFARLECGHTREQHPNESLKESKNLSCFHCDMVLNPHKETARDWYQMRSTENLALAELHKKILTLI